MCGILGLIRRTYPGGASQSANNVIKAIFANLMSNSQSRGADSSGMFVLNKFYKTQCWQGSVNKDVIKSRPLVALNKAQVKSKNYIETDEYKDMIALVSDWTVSMVGHTREATKGTSAHNKNNHPFICGNIIGVHNGVIENWRAIKAKYKLDTKGDCDSEVIFALINHHKVHGASLVEAIKESCTELAGTLTCAVADISKPEKLVLFRRGNPLSMRVLDSPHPTIMFASSDDFLTRAFENLHEDSKGLKIIDWKRVIIENNTGVLLDTGLDQNKWLKEALKFHL